MRSLLLLGAVAVAALVITFAALSLVAGHGDDEPQAVADVPVTVVLEDVPSNDVDLARELLEAWWRSRLATYRVESEFVRTLDDGSSLRLDRVVVQRPPDVVVQQSGTVRAEVDGQIVRCTPGPDDSLTCTSGLSEADYRARAEAELEVLVSWLRGEPPIYELSREDGCFHLELVRAVLEPPYGRSADLCFDQVSGALRRLRIERRGSVDEIVARSISTDVDESDLTSALAPG